MKTQDDADLVKRLCAPGHAAHMTRVKQDEWLRTTLAQADKRQAAGERQLEKDVELFRKTGTWPEPTPTKKKKNAKDADTGSPE